MKTHPASRFIECLTGDPATPCVFQLLADHTSCTVEPRTYKATLANVLPALQHANAQGAGVFITVNQTRGKRRVASEVSRIRALFVDGDDQQMPAAWDVPPTLLHRRSATRWAAFWVLSDDMPLGLFRAAQGALAAKFGGDGQVVDLPRVMRLPGFDHCKNPDSRATYEIVDADELRVYAWRDLLGRFGIDPDQLPVDAPEVYGPPLLARELPDDERQTLVARLRSLPTDAGKRHNAMLGWVHDAIGGGMPREDVEAHAHAYLTDAGVDRDNRREVYNAIRAAEKKARAGSLRINTPGIRPGADFAATATAEPAAPLASAAADAQTADMLDPLAGVTRNDEGVAHATESNALLFLRSPDHGLRDLVSYCMLRQETLVATNPPWSRHGADGVGWDDIDDTRLTIYFQRNCQNPKWEPTKIRSAVIARARERTVHPIRQYLDALTWDGKPRIDSMLPRLWGAEDSTYHRAIGAKTMIAAVRRIRRPGCKVDTMLILEGPQGCGKSRSLRRLLPTEDWFADPEMDIGHKDAAQQIRGKWIIEMGELAGLKRSEVANLKAFITRQADRQRDAYARHVSEVPRQCIFVGTTNEEEYLKDPTGGRRFWPVRCGRIDLEGIERERDQLWAEADARAKAGEPHWLDGQLEVAAKAQQADRQISDPWAAIVAEYLAGVGDFGQGQPQVRVTVSQVLAGALASNPSAQDAYSAHRVGGILRDLGWVKKRVRAGGILTWVWEPGATV